MEPYIEFIGALQNSGFWLVTVCIQAGRCQERACSASSSAASARSFAASERFWQPRAQLVLSLHKGPIGVYKGLVGCRGRGGVRDTPEGSCDETSASSDPTKLEP